MVKETVNVDFFEWDSSDEEYLREFLVSLLGGETIDDYSDLKGGFFGLEYLHSLGIPIPPNRLIPRARNRLNGKPLDVGTEMTPTPDNIRGDSSDGLAHGLELVYHRSELGHGFSVLVDGEVVYDETRNSGNPPIVNCYVHGRWESDLTRWVYTDKP